MKNDFFSQNNSARNIFLTILLFVQLSCETFMLPPDPVNTPTSNFEYLWADVHERYSFFELKQLDWDSVYRVYQPMISDQMSDKELFKVLGNMLYTLRDGHVNLTSEFDRSRNWNWHLDYEPNFNNTLVERKYLGKNYFITGPLKNQLIDSVLYVYYSSFSNQISNQNLDELMERAQKCKGIIFDVRHNGGGSLSNAVRLTSCFTNEKFVYAKERVKTGPGDNDFSEWGNMVVPSRDGERFTGPVVVLLNRTCYSATSFFAQMMSCLPQAILMGDQTGGGGGIPASGELPNGWRYRLSVTQTVTLTGDHIETGVPVDRLVSLNKIDEQREEDTLIETALKYIFNQE